MSSQAWTRLGSQVRDTVHSCSTSGLCMVSHVSESQGRAALQPSFMTGEHRTGQALVCQAREDETQSSEDGFPRATQSPERKAGQVYPLT